VAHADTEAQAADVAAILTDLGVSAETPQLELWNKTDLLTPEARAEMQAIADRRDTVLTLSALTGAGVPELLEAISRALSPPRLPATLLVPYSEGRKRAWLFEQGVVEEETAGETGYEIRVTWTARQKQAFAAL